MAHVRRTLLYLILLVILLLSALPAWPAPPAPDLDLNVKAKEYLESASGIIAATPPDFQPGALLQLASVELAAQLRQPALEHLNQAFAASAALPTERDYRIREEMQGMTAALMARLNLDRAAEMISAIQPAAAGESDQRVVAVNAIARQLLSARKTDDAIGVIERFSPDGLFPFDAAGLLLRQLPAGDARRDVLCAQAVTAFRQRPDVEAFNIFLRNHREHIPALSFNAGVVALAQATLERKGLPRPLLFSITTPKGNVSVTDPYDAVLFQMIDLVQDADPDLARRMLQGRPGLQPILERYPRGQTSLHADGEAVITWTDGAGKDGRPTAAQQQRAAVVALEGSLVQQAMSALSTDPGKYLGIVQQMPTPRLRARMFSTYAMFAAGKPPAEALPMIRRAAGELAGIDDPAARSTAWVTFASASAKAGDTEQAVQCLHRALSAAREQLAADANADSPNLAPKCLWPSAAALRAVFYRAAAILGPAADSLLDQIPDPQLQVIARIEMAAQWLSAPASPPLSKVRRKTAT